MLKRFVTVLATLSLSISFACSSTPTTETPADDIKVLEQTSDHGGSPDIVDPEDAVGSDDLQAVDAQDIQPDVPSREERSGEVEGASWVLAPNTVLVEGDALDAILSVDDGGATLTIDASAPWAAKLDAGDILMAGIGDQTPEGLLRGVLAIDEADGQLVVQTRPATLEEGFEELNLSVVVDMPYGEMSDVEELPEGFGSRFAPLSVEGSASAGFDVGFEDEVLYDGDGNHKTTDDQVVANGGIEFNAALEMEVEIKWFKLKRVKVGPTVSADSEIIISTTIPALSFEKKKDLAKLKFPPFSIGPVVIKTDIDLEMGAEASLEAQIETSVNVGAEVSAGAIYENKKWTPYADVDHTLDYTPPELTASANVKAWVGPRLETKIYGVAGPYAQVNGFLELAADINDDPWWDLKAGLEGFIGIKGEILGYVLLEFKTGDLIGLSWSLAKALEDPPCQVDCSGLQCGPDPVCGESCGTCSDGFVCADGQCVAACGNGECGDGESCASCPSDCGSCCGNGDCGAGEDYTNCPADCPCEADCGGLACGPDPICGQTCGTCDPGFACVAGECLLLETCGNDACDDLENWQSCPQDCPCPADCDGLECGLDPVCGESCGQCDDGFYCSQGVCLDLCGNGVCDDGEAFENCPDDCDCIPECDGLECGADPVCGQTCGECDATATCQDGLCVSDCGNGECGDNESCGSCPEDCGDCCDDGGCDDGVDCPTCPVAPPECNQTGGFGVPTAGTIVPVASEGFVLYDNGSWEDQAALIDAIAAHDSVTEVTLDTVLGDLNRFGSKIASVSGLDCFHTGFKWNSGDNGVDYWYPQGITGTGDAFANGAYNDKKIGLSSWYHKPEKDSAGSPDKGVRLAIYDVTNMNSVQYRWALLVEPVLVEGTADFQAVPVHAGGIVWYGDYLYVADTTQGFRVFDMTRILDVQGGDKNLIGLQEAGYTAHNYSYVVPQVARYQLCGGSCTARFSFVSLDRSTTPHSLVAGEYSNGNTEGRIHRWPLDEGTGRLQTTDGWVQSNQAIYPGVSNMQGGLAYDGQFYIAASGGGLGLYLGKPGDDLQERDWPYGPEDLHYAPMSGNLWSLTEHPNQRYVFAVKLDEIAGINCTPGCGNGVCADSESCQSCPQDCECPLECTTVQCGPDPVTGAECGGCEEGAMCQYGKCVTSLCDGKCVEMVPIPEGTFWMGCNEAIDANCKANEKPFHEVFLDAYYIDKTEVTQEAFEPCVEDGVCETPTCIWDPVGYADRPVTCVSWFDAQAYCEWAGRRLCTEAEWERGARGDDGQIYPWGNEKESCTYAIQWGGVFVGFGCGWGWAAPVCSKPAGNSPWGLCDMAGNLGEWVWDRYKSDYYSESPYANPKGPGGNGSRPVKGGYYYLAPDLYWVRASTRNTYSDFGEWKYYGFRCCRYQDVNTVF